jgi:predicted MFS family arabinose efflux permease
MWLAVVLAALPAAIALALAAGLDAASVVVVGLILFGIIFALNSSVHSFLILAYTDNDKVAMNVGFYYMANACGRLAGTVLSGLLYQKLGLVGCLWTSAGLVVTTGLISCLLPTNRGSTVSLAAVGGDE